MTDHTDINPAGPPERDLRLDLLRGIGQWMVFLDHTPYDIVGWLTIRNYGFSDATEFFVFISGYCAGYIYGPAMRRGEFSLEQCAAWAARYPEQVPQINGEFEYLAAFTPEVRE